MFPCPSGRSSARISHRPTTSPPRSRISSRPALCLSPGGPDGRGPERVSRARTATKPRGAKLAEPLGRYARMLEIRLVEDESMSLFHEGLISGTMHTCQGQEAVAVGVAAALRPTDTVTCTYRGHGHALALGLSPLAVVAELLGRRAGVLEGKGGSMHLVAPDVGLLPTFAIVGAGIPISAGAAYASHVLRGNAVAPAIFRDV